jgi:hypothetical protein
VLAVGIAIGCSICCKKGHRRHHHDGPRGEGCKMEKMDRMDKKIK